MNFQFVSIRLRIQVKVGIKLSTHQLQWLTSYLHQFGNYMAILVYGQRASRQKILEPQHPIAGPSD